MAASDPYALQAIASTKTTITTVTIVKRRKSSGIRFMSVRSSAAVRNPFPLRRKEHRGGQAACQEHAQGV